MLNMSLFNSFLVNCITPCLNVNRALKVNIGRSSNKTLLINYVIKMLDFIGTVWIMIEQSLTLVDCCMGDPLPR